MVYFMKTKIFIDGSEGTTGLRIHERFQGRDDIELLTISQELRKDVNAKMRIYRMLGVMTGIFLVILLV